VFRARAAFISTKSRWIEATIQHIKLRDSIVTYITDTMHAMFSIVAISFEEFKRHFTSVEDTASVLVWVDAQLQQLFNVFAKTVLPSGNLELIARCCSEALKYCELLEAKGIKCAHSFTSLLQPYLQKELQVGGDNAMRRKNNRSDVSVPQASLTSIDLAMAAAISNDHWVP
jgi:hypothetical protein